MNLQLLNLYAEDPAGLIPESELLALSRGLPVGAAEAVCPTLKVCPSIVCSIEPISCTTVTLGCYCPTPMPTTVSLA